MHENELTNCNELSYDNRVGAHWALRKIPRNISGGFCYADMDYSLVRLPFLARVLEYRTSRMVPMTPAETALEIAATTP